MSYRRFLWLPLVCAAALTASEPKELPAVLGRDAELVIDAAGKARPTVRLEKGRAISIVPELSNDVELYVASTAEGAQIGGWIERAAVHWPDGNPVEGDPDESEETPRVAKAKEKPSKKSSKKEKKKTKPVEIAAPKAEPPAEKITEKSLHELLLGLVTEASTTKYATVVVKDKGLSRDEKVAALKIFHKYLQEKRTQLRAGADEKQKERFQKESEDLLANLSSLDEKAKSAEKIAEASKSEAKPRKPRKSRKHGKSHRSA